jgi:hypothetical protein
MVSPTTGLSGQPLDKREAKLAYLREWREANKDYLREQRAKNKDAVNAYDRERRSKNREALNARERELYAKNRPPRKRAASRPLPSDPILAEAEKAARARERRAKANPDVERDPRPYRGDCERRGAHPGQRAIPVSPLQLFKERP